MGFETGVVNFICKNFAINTVILNLTWTYVSFYSSGELEASGERGRFKMAADWEYLFALFGVGAWSENKLTYSDS